MEFMGDQLMCSLVIADDGLIEKYEKQIIITERPIARQINLISGWLICLVKLHIS